MERKKKIRYAVLGLGHIAQTAVLPAFKNAKKNSELKALISSDPDKLKFLSKKYGVESVYSESNFIDCLKSGEIDALYIATPNTDHHYYAEEALNHGIHVLCEKPVAESVSSARIIFEAVKRNQSKMMVAYRLHFEPANLKAIETAQSGKLGSLRIMNSTFTFAVEDEQNIRLRSDKGGGPLRDIGIYCINAARYLFSAEPTEVFAFSASAPNDARFKTVPEMISVLLKFPEERLASFVCSFGASDTSRYDLIGTKGSLSLTSAYDYAEPMHLTVKIGDRERIRSYPKHDQFAPELIYFSECILKDIIPEPSVTEGLIDLMIVEAIDKSIETGQPVVIDSLEKVVRPTPDQAIQRPAVKEPSKIHVSSPSGKH